MLVDKILKKDSRNAYFIIKWLVLFYAGLNISYYVIAYFSPAEMVSFGGRTTGFYSFTFYLMLACNTILPLLLLFKKMGYNKYVLLILSLLISMGWIFELFVIYSINMDRDYTKRLSFNPLWFIVLNGVFIGSVIYAIGRAFKGKVPNIDTPIS
jgi:hypothetical protein